MAFLERVGVVLLEEEGLWIGDVEERVVNCCVGIW